MTVEKKLFWDATFPGLTLRGLGVRSFLNGQTTSNILELEENKNICTCWLNANGNVQAILEIKLTDCTAEILLLSGDINALEAGFDKVIFPSDNVQIDSSWTIRRVQLLSSNRWGGDDEVFWISPHETLPENLVDSEGATLEELQRWFFLQELGLGGNEVNGQNNPFELRLLDLIDPDKGCYLGQEVIAKLFRAKLLRKQLMFWRSNLRIQEGEEIFLNPEKKKIVGLITSSFVLQGDKTYIGFAIIYRGKFSEKDFYVGETLRRIDLYENANLCQFG